MHIDNFLRTVHSLLPRIRRQPALYLNTFDDWWKVFHKRPSITGRFDVVPPELVTAAIGGFVADRMAYAFAAGYQTALWKWLPWVSGKIQDGKKLPAVYALCVTEAGGNHPGDIKTTVTHVEDEYSFLSGEKTFVTQAKEADYFLVAAVEPTDTSRQRVRVALLERDTPGLALTLLPDLPFIPEIRHGKLTLKDVLLSEDDFLKGDGYADYIKAFRTIEDIQVFAGILGYLYRLACLYRWHSTHRVQLIALLTTLEALTTGSPSWSAVHLALAGVFHQFHYLLSQLDWSTVAPEVHALWERDKPLLNVAEEIRKKRTEIAWQKIESL